MVNAWMFEVTAYKNVFADYQVIHFYRYVLFRLLYYTYIILFTSIVEFTSTSIHIFFVRSRWLRSSSALLYDPALYRTLHTYMKKLYIQLIAEFKTLGCIIVFANFNRIIICTRKRTVGDALGYMEFVVKTIQNKELFHGIEITFDQCWEYLIWLDLVCTLIEIAPFTPITV